MLFTTVGLVSVNCIEQFGFNVLQEGRIDVKNHLAQNAVKHAFSEVMLKDGDSGHRTENPRATGSSWKELTGYTSAGKNPDTC